MGSTRRPGGENKTNKKSGARPVVAAVLAVDALEDSRERCAQDVVGGLVLLEDLAVLRHARLEVRELPPPTAPDAALHQQQRAAGYRSCSRPDIVVTYRGMAGIVVAFVIMAGIAMAYLVMAYIVMTYIVMAHIVMAYMVMACMVMACIVMAYIVMAYMLMAYIVMAYMLMAYILLADIVMAYIVMAYIVMACIVMVAQRTG